MSRSTFSDVDEFGIVQSWKVARNVLPPSSAQIRAVLLCLFAVFLVFIKPVYAKKHSRFSASEAMFAAYDSLALSPVDSAIDSIAVRLTVMDSSENTFIVYELRYSHNRASALRHKAQALQVIKKRFWGLLPAAVYYTPQTSVEELLPYTSIHSFIGELPKLQCCDESQNPKAYTVLFEVVENHVKKSCFCNSVDNCVGFEVWLAFFESNFYYQNL